MSFEAITKVSAAESAAKAAVAAAEAKARQLVIDAESAGKAAVNAATAKAEAELAELRKKTDAKAVSDAQELSKQLEVDKEALRRTAEVNLDKAAAQIVERIVKS